MTRIQTLETLAKLREQQVAALEEQLKRSPSSTLDATAPSFLPAAVANAAGPDGANPWVTGRSDEDAGCDSRLSAEFGDGGIDSSGKLPGTSGEPLVLTMMGPGGDANHHIAQEYSILRAALTPDLVAPGPPAVVSAYRVSACLYSSGAHQRHGPRRKGRSPATLARREAEKEERAIAHACLMSRVRTSTDSAEVLGRKEPLGMPRRVATSVWRQVLIFVTFILVLGGVTLGAGHVG